MQEHTVLCINSKTFHRMHYTDWGDADNPDVVVCVHGLTRNCRDFDALAAALSPDFRVICPSIAGRGSSDWLPAKEDYGYPQYAADITALFARIGTRGGEPRIHWVGTSMGGMLGMLLACRPGQPIRRLVLNDVGTLITKESMARIGTYVGKDARFRTIEETEQYVRTVSAPFGPLTDAQWRHLTIHNAKQHTDGSWGMNYDPGIALPFQKVQDKDIDLSAYYDAVTCPTLLLRGADSDLLRRDTALDMTRRGPKARLVEFSGVGHAPMLMAEDQIRVTRKFLLER